MANDQFLIERGIFVFWGAYYMWICLNCKNENKDKDEICLFCGTSKDLVQPDMLVSEEGRRGRKTQSIDLMDLGMEQMPYTENLRAKKTPIQPSSSDTDVLRTRQTADAADYDESMEATIVLANPEEAAEQDSNQMDPKPKKQKRQDFEDWKAQDAPNVEKSAASTGINEATDTNVSPSPTAVPEMDKPVSSSATGPVNPPSEMPRETSSSTETAEKDQKDREAEEEARKQKEKEKKKTIRIAVGAAVVSVIALILILLLPKKDTERPEETTSSPTPATSTVKTTTETPTTEPVTEKKTEPVTEKATEKATEIKKEGWVEVDGKTYFYKEKNVASKGWVEYSGVWYYFDSMGVMQTGWLTEKNQKYYLDERGVMAVGWLELNGKYYYFNEKGQMQTGWQEIDEAKYYFRPDGVNVTEEWVDGLWLEKNGRQIYEYKGEFHEDEKGKWFGDESGWFAKNQKLTIDGVEYEFDKKGYLVN